MALGEPLYYLGKLAPAREHCEQAIALYDPWRPRPPWSWGDDKVSSLSHMLCILWLLGYSEQSQQRSREALALARELSHPISLAFAQIFTAILHQLRREGHAAQERAETAITLSTEQGFTQWLVMGTILRGWALAEQGQAEEGTVQLRQGLAASQALGVELGRPYWLALLAEAYGKAGRAEDGLAALAEALTVVDKRGERFYEAELYRLKGELTLQQLSVVSNQLSVTHPQAEAEEYFQKAVEIARTQQAKALELWAMMSLAHLWQSQGKKAIAHQMLSEIYGWFTEGFDTKDLQEAKALLEESN
jgi:predicted ATPase